MQAENSNGKNTYGAQGHTPGTFCTFGKYIQPFITGASLRDHQRTVSRSSTLHMGHKRTAESPFCNNDCKVFPSDIFIKGRYRKTPSTNISEGELTAVLVTR